MKLQELNWETMKGRVCAAVAGDAYLIQILDLCTPPLTCNWEVKVAIFGGGFAGEETTLEFTAGRWSQLPLGETAFWWDSGSIAALDGKSFDLEVV